MKSESLVETLGLTPMKGVTLRHEPKRSQPYGVWVEAIIAGKERRGRKGFNTLDAARIGYNAVCDEIGKLRAHAEEDEQRRKALAVPELPAAPKGTTLFEPLAKRWLEEHVKAMCEAATYRGYDGNLRRHLLPIMRTWPVTDAVMTPQRLKDVLKNQLFAKGLGLPTRRACQRCLSAFFGWALGELPPGQLVRNPLKEQALYIRQESEKHVKLHKPANPMTPAQADAFLVWIKEHYPGLYEYFLWLIDEGPRISEVTPVRWTQLDLDRGQAHVLHSFSYSERQRELQRGNERGLGEKDTKTHRENQYIDLSERVVMALKTLKPANLERWLARGRRGKEPEHVFLNERLRPRRPDKIVYRAFHEACEALKLVGQTGERFTPHCLRDTFATLAILDGKPVGWVSMMLGHADETMVRKTYYKWIRLMEENPLMRRQK